MYKILAENGEVLGESPTLVPICLGENGAYQECESGAADGFCVKLPVVTEMGTELIDTVFQLPGHTLHGDEPYGKAEVMGAYSA